MTFVGQDVVLLKRSGRLSLQRNSSFSRIVPRAGRLALPRPRCYARVRPRACPGGHLAPTSPRRRDRTWPIGARPMSIPHPSPPMVAVRGRRRALGPGHRLGPASRDPPRSAGRRSRRRSRRRWPEAEARLLPWLERSPDDGQAWLRLGGVLAFEGRDAEALDALGHVKPADPAWPAAQMHGRRELAQAPRDDEGRGGPAFAVERGPAAVDPRRRLVLSPHDRPAQRRGAADPLGPLSPHPRPAAARHDRRDRCRPRPTAATSASRSSPSSSRRPTTPGPPRLGPVSSGVRPDGRGASPTSNRPPGRSTTTRSAGSPWPSARSRTGDHDAAESTLGPEPARPADLARWWLIQATIREAQGPDRARRSTAGRSPSRSARTIAPCSIGSARPSSARARPRRRSRTSTASSRSGSARSAWSRLDRLVRGERTVALFEQLAALCRDAGRPAEARGWYEEVVRLDPTHAKAQVALVELAATPSRPVLAPDFAAGLPRAASVAAKRRRGVVADPVRGRREGVGHRLPVRLRREGRHVPGRHDGRRRRPDRLRRRRPARHLLRQRLPAARSTRSRRPGPTGSIRNKGDGTFEDVTARAGVGRPRLRHGLRRRRFRQRRS